jgi:hypothetical protein
MRASLCAAGAQHGTFPDDETMRMMHDRGVSLVPTLTTRIGLQESKSPPLVQARADRAVAGQDTMRKRAVGTESAVFPG